MNPTEDDLCRAFANKLKESPEFASWLLDRTGFSGDRSRARLLHEEQVRRRPHVDAENWWRHWHSAQVKKSGRGQETDIFLVFEPTESKKRFALCIENKKRRVLSKREADEFREQAEAYEPRARFMRNKHEFLSYDDFVTVLVAPIAFRNGYIATCDLFNFYIAYENVANFIPDYHVSVLR